LASPGVLRYLVGPEIAGQRLDRGLALLSGLSRRQVRQLLAEGAVWLDGRPCRVASKLLKVGHVLDLLPPAAPPNSPAPPPPPLPLLFEDGHLLACDKPPGMLTQPGKERLSGELAAVEHLVLQLSFREGHRVELYVVHRLDRVASGLLLFAKHHDAAAACSQAFASGEVEKVYLAVVAGNPNDQGTIAAPVAPDPLLPGRFRVAPRGEKAVTRFRVLARGERCCLLEVRPETGRSHQIRVHLASMGCPIVGDSLYGAHQPAPRPLLHAWRLALPHPKDRHRLLLEAPLPGDLLAFCRTHTLAIPNEASAGATGFPL